MASTSSDPIVWPLSIFWSLNTVISFFAKTLCRWLRNPLRTSGPWKLGKIWWLTRGKEEEEAMSERERESKKRVWRKYKCGLRKQVRCSFIEGKRLKRRGKCRDIWEILRWKTTGLFPRQLIKVCFLIAANFQLVKSDGEKNSGNRRTIEILQNIYIYIYIYLYGSKPYRSTPFEL